jgi:hypothetical protein
VRRLVSISHDRLTVVLTTFVYRECRGSSVRIVVTRLLFGRQGLDSLQGRGRDFVLFATASRQALGSTQPHIQWVPEDRPSGVKRPRREADHSPPPSVEVNNA